MPLLPSFTAQTALLFLSLAVALGPCSVSAQSSRSIDPLNGTTFSSAFFTPAMTYTPVTTFAQATGGVQTVLSGVGPSIAPSAALFTYTIPTASVSPTDNAGVIAALASSANYATATDARNLAPNPDNLQIADDAARLGTSVFALCASALVGALVVLAL